MALSIKDNETVRLVVSMKRRLVKPTSLLNDGCRKTGINTMMRDTDFS